MPTSSQAMILRCNEASTKSTFQVGFSSPVEFRGSTSTDSKDTSNFERVLFDFSVNTSPEKPMSGYEGVFAFDNDSNSYKWIFPMDLQHKCTNDTNVEPSSCCVEREEHCAEEQKSSGSDSYIDRYTNMLVHYTCTYIQQYIRLSGRHVYGINWLQYCYKANNW